MRLKQRLSVCDAINYGKYDKFRWMMLWIPTQPFKPYFLLKNVYNLFFFYIVMIFVYILCDVFFLFHVVLFVNSNQRWAFFNNLYLLDKIVRFELWPFNTIWFTHFSFFCPILTPQDTIIQNWRWGTPEKMLYLNHTVL